MLKKLFLYRRLCTMCQQPTMHARTSTVFKGSKVTSLMECGTCGKAHTEDKTPEEHYGET